jgi:hypothetical protein
MCSKQTICLLITTEKRLVSPPQFLLSESHNKPWRHCQYSDVTLESRNSFSFSWCLCYKRLPESTSDEVRETNLSLFACICMYVCVCFSECSDILLQYNYRTVFPRLYATLQLGLAAQALFSSPSHPVCYSLIFIALFYCQFICLWMNVDAADFFEKLITTYIVYTIYISYVVYTA